LKIRPEEITDLLNTLSFIDGQRSVH